MADNPQSPITFTAATRFIMGLIANLLTVFLLVEGAVILIGSVCAAFGVAVTWAEVWDVVRHFAYGAILRCSFLYLAGKHIDG
jgi:hypothetical protein